MNTLLQDLRYALRQLRVRSSDNFFQVFGIRPLLGRTYAEGENLDGKTTLLC
jgi:hypothetical protein